jgi:hypothetical protein
MSKGLKYTLAALAAAAAAAVTVAADTAGADPLPVNDHTHGFQPIGTFSHTWCGEVPGTMTVTANVQHREDADGSFTESERAIGVFTATATGKSLLILGAGRTKVEIVDNGDGTTSYISSGGGQSLQFKIPNGSVLKEASGRPIIGAGSYSYVEVVDNATNQTIWLAGTFHGPSPLGEGVDICASSVAYLLDP